MAPPFLYDISSLDLNKVVIPLEEIRKVIPQRFEMEMLSGIIHYEEDVLVGFKDLGLDEFWVRGHIPGRPLLPGVLMIEAGAQLASFYTRKFVGWQGFIGFGAADQIRFRQMVTPGNRMYIVGQKTWHRHRRICCKIQGLVDGNVVFEAEIVGSQF